MISERNTNIDCAKAIAACFVVFIHVKFPEGFGIAIDAISRFSVALFFIISGYFSFACNSAKAIASLRRQAKKIFLLAFASTVAYWVFALAAGMPHETRSLLDMSCDLLLFNKPSGTLVFADPLWFLYALGYCHLAMILFLKAGWQRRFMTFAILLLAGHFVVRETGRALLPPGSMLNQFYTVRNFLLFGLPFYLIGNQIYRYTLKLKRISNIWVLGFIILSIPLTLIELWLSGRNSVYLGTSICATAVMILCVNNPNGKKYPWIALCGRKYSACVYILHPLIWNVLPFIFFHLGLWLNPAMPWLIPFIVIGVSFLCSHILMKLYSAMVDKWIRAIQLR